MIIKGDISGDGKITSEDYVLSLFITASNFMPEADINNDGVINTSDHAMIRLHIEGSAIITEVIE